MWNMRSASNVCCGLSKGTQSDGLISDTSTEGFTSASSTENLEKDEVFENIVAKESTEVGNGSRNSTSSIHVKLSESLHQMQTQCQLYIRWGVLFSFGILLWIALWIMDVFHSNPFLKEDVATAKKVTLKAEIMTKPAPSTWWFFNIWRYAYNSIVSMTSLDMLMILGCMIILVYLENHVINTWGGTIGRLCYAKFYPSSHNTCKEQSETDGSTFHVKMLEEDSKSKELDTKSFKDDFSQFSHGDVRNLTAQDKTKVNSRLGEESIEYWTQGGRLSIKNRISKPLKGSHNTHNTRKRPRQVNGGKNYCNLTYRRNNLSRDIVTSELILDKPNFDVNCVSSTSKNDEAKLIPGKSNLTCSIFNKSTNYMSEEIETWFELPNSDQAEKVMHSFDMELEEFFKTRSNSSLLSFGETTRDLQRFNKSSVGCECEEPSKAVILNVDYNRGIISSSPAFRRFLVNLAKDRLSETYL